METNTLFTFTPDPTKVPKNYLVDAFLNRLQYIQLEYGVELVHSPMVRHDPILLDPSPKLILPEQRRREHDMLTNGQFYLPAANLPFAARGLLEQVKNFELTEEEIMAIQYSVQTEGRFLYNIIKGKGKPGLTGYLRADLQTARRTAPGQEMVLEIWLPSGASSIHNHGDSSAVIKVLHGKITSEFYNPIMDRMRERPS
ncbi:uncharacterized protein LOC129594005 [Paramacrobiotus metropolitanus]|uniref:uncharacterized protein LOC129594005 n=1 Tax=Paramacrobiotus metropolitanus TaxID=2943436 RepID=UPI00244633E9|nr:uncharacterized protein LOC129594005 [Paramacrobiotus metropolitanus]